MSGWREVEFQGVNRFTDARCILGAGGSTTYDVLDRALGERVWIKEVPRAFSGDADAFVHEYEMLRRLAPIGPHVLRVHELFVGTHDIAFSSERLEGELLDAPDGRFERDASRLRPLLTQLVMAIDAVHRSGIVHRDIKPSNVFETAAGRVVLLGFELAASISEPRPHGGDTIIGTPIYIAPEVLRGERATEATDFYAVGTMLFEALTGRLPFEWEHLATLLKRKLREPAPLPSDVAQGVPADLDQLCAALLDRDPAKRPGAGAILRALEASAPQDPARNASE